MSEKLITFTLTTLGLNSQLAMRKETLAVISAHRKIDNRVIFFLKQKRTFLVTD